MGGRTKLSKRKINKMNKNEEERIKQARSITERWALERDLRITALKEAAQVHLGSSIESDKLIDYAEKLKGYIAANDLLNKLQGEMESKDFENKIKMS